MSKDSVYQQLRGHLAYLKLAATAETLPAHLQAARRSDIGHTEFLEGLLRVEVEATEARRWTARMRFANFPTPSQLEDFDFSAQPSIDEKLVRELACGAYLTDATNVLFIGPPGVGKTMLAVILGRTAVDGGHRVYYTTAADLAARCPNSSPRRPMGHHHEVLLRTRGAHNRRTRLPAHADRRRRRPVPGHLPPIPERIGHPHHQPQRRVLGRHLLRQHHRRRDAGPAPPQKRRVHHHRRQLPAPRLPCPSPKTPTERRPPLDSQNAPRVGNFSDQPWVISVIAINSFWRLVLASSHHIRKSAATPEERAESAGPSSGSEAVGTFLVVYGG